MDLASLAKIVEGPSLIPNKIKHNPVYAITQMSTEDDCKCIRISGHLEAVRWLLWPRKYEPNAGYLSLGDWTADPHIWLHYVESTDGLMADDDVLLSTDTRYWSIHDVQRYFFGDMHCEKVLFTYQYPNLRMPSRLGSYFWRANTALKLPPALYQKEFNRSFEVTLKKLEANEAQMSRLMISDQLIKIDRLDDFKRKTFFRILMNIMSFQDRLQVVSLENLCCKRLEGVRLIQQLACFNADTLKYLFLWRFVLPNENPLLINYSYLTEPLNFEAMRINSSGARLRYGRHDYRMKFINKLLNPSFLHASVMTTDEEKSRIAKILQGMEVPEMKLSERCSDLIKDFHQKFDREVEEEAQDNVMDEVHENPYRVDRHLLEENERKLRELLAESKRQKCNVTGSGQYIPRPESRHCFLRSLGELHNLRVLALEYSHIADGTGSALLSLLPVIKRPHFRLQLICREDQTPGRADAALGVGGYDIPDTAWRRVNIACPELYLHMAFFRIRDYDNIRRFLVPSIPLRDVHLQLGIDMKMKQRQDSDLSCFIRHVAYRYANTLVSLSIHQWRFAVFPLRRVFELMPRLGRFHYIGRVEDDVDLRRMFLLFSCGVCNKLKQVNIQIQDEEPRRIYWRKVVDSLTSEYADIMLLYNIKFCITVYKN